MRSENDRLVVSSKLAFASKRNWSFYLVFLGCAALFLLIVYIFCQRDQQTSYSSLNFKRRSVVSLSQPVKPVTPVPSVVSSFLSETVFAQNQSREPVFTKVFARFTLLSSDYLLAQIGAPELPKAIYRSSEGLQKLFTDLLESLDAQKKHVLEAKKGRQEYVLLEKEAFFINRRAQSPKRFHPVFQS